MMDFINQMTDIIYHIRYKLPQTLQPRNVKNLFILAIAILAILLLAFSNVKPKTVSFEKFSDTTNKMFEDVNSITANTIKEQHEVECRRVASMIQRSPAFEFHGCQIATGLRKFREKIIAVGQLLQKMYSKGSEVYKLFDVEIEGMMNRLDLNQRKGKTEYFKERLKILITTIKEFRHLVEETQGSVKDAEKVRDDTEGYIMKGIREAKDFINNDLDYLGHTIDKNMVTKEILVVEKFLSHLKNTASHLEKMKNILLAYEDNLSSVSDELEDVSKENELFEVTKEDLESLKFVVLRAKDSHLKFIERTLISC
ncbi:hypothetical protein C1645_244593 [Glomus cerebriforme]|uniref:Uncharacterized protein n=1 Tax=Glomus cerebriforme TaxID=658196 RepID=A0A397SQH6_9GLOM|nr:hypothetical protein C1645_244593 [Glomus cerebriforme]